MQQKLLEQWTGLQAREKILLAIAGLLLVLTLVVTLIVQPLRATVLSAKQSLQQKQTLLAWLQPRVAKIRMLPTAQFEPLAITRDNLLSTVDSAIKASSFASGLSLIKQNDNNAVTIQFKAIAYNPFIKWLVKQWQTKRLSVSQLGLQKTDATGIVDVSLTVTPYSEHKTR